MRQRAMHLWGLAWLAVLVMLAPLAPRDSGRAQEQLPPPSPPASPASQIQPPQILHAEAVGGQPWGVGQVVFRLSPDDAMIAASGGQLVWDREGRVLYPAYGSLLREGLSALLGSQIAPSDSSVHTVSFVFHGDQPLDLIVSGGADQAVRVDVEARRPRIHQRMFRQWWRQFNAQVRENVARGDYPPLVEAYLTAMLARRLNLEPPLLERLTSVNRSELQKTFDLVFDVEAIRAEAIAEMAGEPVPRGPLVPLPASVAWRPLPLAAPVDVPVEPMALRVAPHWLYLRFGAWSNQLWFKELLADYGGDLGSMIQLRGRQTDDQAKMLDQLVLESRQLDDLFAGRLIEDIAVVGHDFYLADGPAIGILFQASGPALERNLSNRRADYAKDHQDEGVTLEAITVGSHEATLLATPDNRVRSFLAQDGNYVLVTTCRRMVEEFFAIADGAVPLGATAEFLNARQLAPVDGEDTVFVYLSSAFFQNLLSPHYQIELARRNRSIAQMQLVQMAFWAARGEGMSDPTFEQLVAGGFLSADSLTTVDGGTIDHVAGVDVDSRRGQRGYYLPIPDTPLEQVWASEAQWFARRAEYFTANVGRLDPLLAAFKRFDLGNNLERVVIDARLAPFDAGKYQWLGSLLGQPLAFEVSSLPDDLATVQASLAARPGASPVDAHQVFVGVGRDVTIAETAPRGLFEWYRFLRELPAHLGAWPKPGYLDWLPTGLAGRPDEAGYTHAPLLGLWRLQEGDFAAVSFDRQRLEQLRGVWGVVPTARHAQVRARIGDVANSNLRSWANEMYFQRACQTSLANVRLLNLLIEQFHMPPDEALAQAEALLTVQLACPLGGDYTLLELPTGRAVWTSTGWPDFRAPHRPEEFLAPPLAWFRGLEMEVTQMNTQFVVHGFLDIQREASRGLFGLPTFDLFQGFRKIEELPTVEPDAPGPAPAESPPLNPPRRDDKR